VLGKLLPGSQLLLRNLLRWQRPRFMRNVGGLSCRNGALHLRDGMLWRRVRHLFLELLPGSQLLLRKLLRWQRPCFVWAVWILSGRDGSFDLFDGMFERCLRHLLLELLPGSRLLIGQLLRRK
jgi:hypothetical protein